MPSLLLCATTTAAAPIGSLTYLTVTRSRAFLGIEPRASANHCRHRSSERIDPALRPQSCSRTKQHCRTALVHSVNCATVHLRSDINLACCEHSLSFRRSFPTDRVIPWTGTFGLYTTGRHSVLFPFCRTTTSLAPQHFHDRTLTKRHSRCSRRDPDFHSRLHRRQSFTAHKPRASNLRPAALLVTGARRHWASEIKT